MREVIEKKVAVVDIPPGLTGTDVCDSSEVDKGVMGKEFFAKRDERSSFSASHDVKFSEVADDVDLSACGD